MTDPDSGAAIPHNPPIRDNPTPEHPAMVRNYSLYESGGEIFAVRSSGDEPPRLFRRTGQTENVRVAVQSDAVIYGDQLLDVFPTEDGDFALSDPWSGTKARVHLEEWIRPALATFEKVDRLFQGDA